MSKRFIPLLLLVAASGLHAGAAANVDPLAAAAAKHERGILKATVDGHPLVETYLQYTPRDAGGPQRDAYSLATIGKEKSLTEDAYQHELASSISGRLFAFAKNVGLGKPEEENTVSFADMLSPDMTGFDAKRYHFEFQRFVFLGSRRMALYDVSPIDKKKAQERGRFLGRIWVDQQDAVIGSSSQADLHPFEILPVVLNYRADDGGTAVSTLQSR